MDPLSREREHKLRVLKELRQAEEIISRVVGPLHIIRKELALLIERQENTETKGE